MNNLKITLIIPTMNQGGAERVMSELANSFVNFANVQVHLILLAKSDDFYKIDKRIALHRLGFENKGKVSKMVSEYRTLISLRKVLKEQKPDAVLSFMEKFNSFSIIASAFLGLKIFVSDRSNPLKEVPKTTEWLRKLTYKYATGIIAQTQFAKEVLEAKTKNSNIRVISNPVKEIKKYPNIDKDKIILNVGRLVAEKGQKYVIEAFADLNRSDWKLVILGEGPLRNELQALVNSYQLNDNVLLLGSVQNVDEWLAKASIFVFPSISEGFPNALVEAMSAGLPCVSFDCDAGPRDIIKNEKNGFIIPIKNVESLKKLINNLIEDENLRIQIGTEAKKISRKLNIDKISREYLDFLNEKKNKKYDIGD